MAGEPLPNLSDFDIQLDRLRREHAQRQQEIASKWQSTVAEAEAYKPSSPDYELDSYRARQMFAQRDANKAWQRTQQEIANLKPSSLDNQLDQIRARALFGQRDARKAYEKTWNQVLGRDRPYPASLPPTPATGGRPVLPDYRAEGVRPAEPRQPLVRAPQVEPLPFAEPPPPNLKNLIPNLKRLATTDIVAPKLPSNLPETLAKAVPRTFDEAVGAARGVTGAVGKVAGPIGIGIEVGTRIAQGQNAAQVVVGTAGATAGGWAGAEAGIVAGAAIGSFAGPIGAAVGGVLGGIVGGIYGGRLGGSAADFLTGANGSGSGVSSAQPPPPQVRQIPLNPGIGTLPVPYRVRAKFAWRLNGQDYSQEYVADNVSGPLGAPEIRLSPYPLPGEESASVAQPGNGLIFNTERTTIGSFRIANFDVSRMDGRPDAGQGSAPAPYPTFAPGTNAIVVAAPSSGVPAGTPNSQGAPIAAPANLPDGQTGRGDLPQWVPTGTPAPGLAPSPNVSPQPLGPPLPETGSPAKGAPTDPTYKPANQSVARGTTHPGSGGAIFPTSNPLILLPLAAGIAVRGKITPTGQRGINPAKAPDPPDFNIPGNTCNLDPCMRGVQQQTQQTNDRLSQLLGAGNLGAEAGSTAAILARLDAIDAKLGAAVPGGLGGLLTNLQNLVTKFSESFEKFAKWAHLDRALNLLTTIATLHNAYMLSNGLSQTLFSMISNSLAVFGIKDYSQDKDGQPFDIAKIFNDFINNIAKAALGASTVDGIKAEWKKYSRIYQAAANIIFSLQSIGYSILGSMEVVGNWVALIGNALKKWGEISDKAFQWFNPQINFQNRFFTAINKTEEFVSQIDQVAQEVLSIEDTVKQLGKQTEDLQKTVAGSDAIATAEATAKAKSQSPAIPLSDQVKPES